MWHGRSTSGFVQIASPVEPNVVRVLGAIYLKNHVNTYWSDGSDHHVSNDPDIQALADAVNVSVPKPTNEQSASVSLISPTDKDYLRNVLIDAIIRTKDPLRWRTDARSDETQRIERRRPFQMPIDHRSWHDDQMWFSIEMAPIHQPNSRLFVNG